MTDYHIGLLTGLLATVALLGVAVASFIVGFHIACDQVKEEVAKLKADYEKAKVELARRQA